MDELLELESPLDELLELDGPLLELDEIRPKLEELLDVRELELVEVPRELDELLLEQGGRVGGCPQGGFGVSHGGAGG